MKIIYKQSLLEQMRDAIDAADRQSKTIERFEVNETEYVKLDREAGSYMMTPLFGGRLPPFRPNTFVGTVYGVPICTGDYGQ